MTSELADLVTRLSKHRKPPPEDHYDVGRVTHCHLVCMDPIYEQIKYPIFEVRGWQYAADPGILEISAVNWTVTAGTCTICLKEHNAKFWKILEDEPTLQVLIGPK